MDGAVGLFLLFILAGVILFAVSFLFDRLPDRSRAHPRTIKAGSGSARSTAGSSSATGLTASSSERAVSIYPPAVFEPRQIQEDLARLVEAPTLFLQYKEKVLTRFTRRNQRVLIEDMVAVYTVTAKLVESGLSVELAMKQHEEKVAELDAKIAKHHRDQVLAEVQAEEALHPKPPPKAPEPEPPKPEPTKEEQIESIEARLRDIRRQQDVAAAVNLDGLPPHLRRRHVLKVNGLNDQEKQLEKGLQRVRRLVV